MSANKKPIKDGSPAICCRRPNDEMRDFTMFLLGREDLTEDEKQEIIQSKAEQQVMFMLKKKKVVYQAGIQTKKEYLQKLTSRMKKAQIPSKEQDLSKDPSSKSIEPLQEREGLTPVQSQSSVDVTQVHQNPQDEDQDENGRYKDKVYWSLPENVRHAIDITKKKSHHSNFYNRLNQLNDKISVYKRVFYTNKPKFERRYIERRREKLGKQMVAEQKELEDYLAKESQSTPHSGSQSAMMEAVLKQHRTLLGGPNDKLKTTMDLDRGQSERSLKVRSVRERDLSGLQRKLDLVRPTGAIESQKKRRVLYSGKKQFQSTCEVQNSNKLKLGGDIGRESQNSKSKQNLKTLEHEAVPTSMGQEQELQELHPSTVELSDRAIKEDPPEITKPLKPIQKVVIGQTYSQVEIKIEESPVRSKRETKKNIKLNELKARGSNLSLSVISSSKHQQEETASRPRSKRKVSLTNSHELMIRTYSARKKEKTTKASPNKNIQSSEDNQKSKKNLKSGTKLVQALQNQDVGVTSTDKLAPPEIQKTPRKKMKKVKSPSSFQKKFQDCRTRGIQGLSPRNFTFDQPSAYQSVDVVRMENILDRNPKSKRNLKNQNPLLQDTLKKKKKNKREQSLGTISSHDSRNVGNIKIKTSALHQQHRMIDSLSSVELNYPIIQRGANRHHLAQSMVDKDIPKPARPTEEIYIPQNHDGGTGGDFGIESATQITQQITTQTNPSRSTELRNSDHGNLYLPGIDDKKSSVLGSQLDQDLKRNKHKKREHSKKGNNISSSRNVRNQQHSRDKFLILQTYGQKTEDHRYNDYSSNLLSPHKSKKRFKPQRISKHQQGIQSHQQSVGSMLSNGEQQEVDNRRRNKKKGMSVGSRAHLMQHINSEMDGKSRSKHNDAFGNLNKTEQLNAKSSLPSLKQSSIMGGQGEIGNQSLDVSSFNSNIQSQLGNIQSTKEKKAKTFKLPKIGKMTKMTSQY